MQPGCILANLSSKRPGGTDPRCGTFHKGEGRRTTLKRVCQNNRLLKPRGYSSREGRQAFSWTSYEHKREYNLRKEAIAEKHTWTSWTTFKKCNAIVMRCNDQEQCPYSGENPTPPSEEKVRMVNHLILVQESETHRIWPPVPTSATQEWWRSRRQPLRKSNRIKETISWPIIQQT